MAAFAGDGCCGLERKCAPAWRKETIPLAEVMMLEWPEDLDTNTQRALIGGALLTWAGGVRRQVERIVRARSDARRDGLRQVAPEEIPDIALLLEAMRIVVELGRAALKTVEEGTEVHGALTKAINEFHRTVPHIEDIRAVSTYYGKAVALGALPVKKGKNASHKDLKYRITIDDETFVVSEFAIIVEGVGEIPVLSCADAVDSFTGSVREAFKVSLEELMGVPGGIDEVEQE